MFKPDRPAREVGYFDCSPYSRILISCIRWALVFLQPHFTRLQSVFYYIMHRLFHTSHFLCLILSLSPEIKKKIKIKAGIISFGKFEASVGVIVQTRWSVRNHVSAMVSEIHYSEKELVESPKMHGRSSQ